MKNSYEITSQGVVIYTESGPVQGSKRSYYIKWLMGWIDGGGWSGETTIHQAWEYGKDQKPEGCSWYAYGLLMAREQNKGKSLCDYAD